MARIAVGGFNHETNVFAPHKAEYDYFLRASGGWPALSRGEKMLDELYGVNLPAANAIDRLRELGHQIVPLLWCSSTPSAHVTEEAFENISAMMIEDLNKSPAVDAVLLDLHGAMVCEHIPDGDGELIRRVRETVGGQVPVAVCLDLHANVSDQMIEQASFLEIYRTYPHVDMGLTGDRAAKLLHRLLQEGLARFPAMTTKRANFLIPPHWASTLMDPARSIYNLLEKLDDDDIQGISLACGFPYSDVAEVGPCVVAYGFDQYKVDKAADILFSEINLNEAAFNGHLYKVDEAVKEAIRLSADANAPIILADTQDNPGGGGPGDTTGLLRALVEHKATGAVVGVIADPQVVAQAHAAGKHATINAQLGEKSGLPGHSPFCAEFHVLNIFEGTFKSTGPMMAGATMNIGATALLETGGVKIVVGSIPMQALDQSMFSHLGVEPAEQKIVALKSSVHFRNDFQDIAAAILLVASPGPVLADLASVPFRHLRPDIRITS